MSLTRNGKRILRAAYEAAGWKLVPLSRKVGCSHPLIRTLLEDEEGLGPDTPPTWSSQHVEALCAALKVPVWMVVGGLKPDHRKVIEALERVRQYAPDRYRAFVASIIEQADDRAARGGWSPDDTTGETRPRSLRVVRPTVEDDS